MSFPNGKFVDLCESKSLENDLHVPGEDASTNVLKSSSLISLRLHLYAEKSTMMQQLRCTYCNKIQGSSTKN